MTNAPDRIWIAAFGGNWSAVKGGTQDVEYARADRADAERAAQPSPDVAELVEAVEAALAFGMIPKSSSADGGANKYSEQVRVADLLRAALARVKGGAA